MSTITRDADLNVWTVTNGTDTAFVVGMRPTTVRTNGTAAEYPNIRSAMVEVATKFALSCDQIAAAGLPVLAKWMREQRAAVEPRKAPKITALNLNDIFPVVAPKPAKVAKPKAAKVEASPYTEKRGMAPVGQDAMAVLASLNGDASDPRWAPAMAAWTAANKRAN